MPFSQTNGPGLLGRTKPKGRDRSISTVPNGDENDVVCNCGQDAISLTVRKDGPNQGKNYHPIFCFFPAV